MPRGQDAPASFPNRTGEVGGVWGGSVIDLSFSNYVQWIPLEMLLLGTGGRGVLTKGAPISSLSYVY